LHLQKFDQNSLVNPPLSQIDTGNENRAAGVMVKLRSSTQTSASSMADELSDDQLLLCIAQQRDREAFAELYRRFARLAFNVAFNVTGNRSLAEEAAQEAMLQLWISAKSYQPGNARGWILRIVARESLELAQKQAKGMKQMEAENYREKPRESDTVDGTAEDAEHNELLVTLRRVLHDLPALERQVVALHFGAGLTQQEIGAALSIPQQTISFKIKKVLEDLRGRLSLAGFTAAAPLLSAEWMNEAICSGIPAPHGMSAQVLLKAASRSRSLRVISRGAPKFAAGAALPIAGAFLAVAIVCSVWITGQSPSPTAAPVKAQPAALAKAEAKPVSLRWSFNDGVPPELGLQNGTGTRKWQWRKSVDGGELFADIPLVITLPVKTPNRPFVLIAHHQWKQHPGVMSSAAFWRNDHASLAHREWSTTRHMNEKNVPDDVALTVYFINGWTIRIAAGTINAVGQVDKPYPTDQVCLIFQNCGLLALEYRELAESEIPPELANIEKVKEQLKAAGAVQFDIPEIGVSTNWLEEQRMRLLPPKP
jgi:RNA polymerase sigma-70 factor (ECF subfamily)